MAQHKLFLNTIEDFLAQKRIAMVGLSRDEKHFSVMLFKEFIKRGYDMVPVNPNAAEILGHKCFARVKEIQPAVDAVLLMTSPVVSEAAVRECAEAGVKRVWMYRAGSIGAVAGAVSEPAVELCREKGIAVVPGACPFMFFPKNGFHKLHGWIEKISGNFPRRAA